MGETRRKFDQDFREGAVRLVRETGKPIAQVARELGIVPGTLENWVAKDRRQREGGDGRLSEDERTELMRLRRENAELAMRCDVLKRSRPSSSTAAFANGPAAAAWSFIAISPGDRDVPATPSSASRGANPCLQASQ